MLKIYENRRYSLLQLAAAGGFDSLPVMEIRYHHYYRWIHL